MSVLSVERFSLSLGDNVLTADGTLNKLQTTGNCIPFITTRVSVKGDAGEDEFQQFACESFFPDGNTVRVQRREAGTGQSQLVCEVTVVEFDGTDTKVQQGTYSLPDTTGSSTTATLSPTVTAANTFLYHTWSYDAPTDDWDAVAIRGRITAPNQLTFDRDGTAGSITGRWYTADATTGGDFTVQAKDIALGSGATSNTASLTSVAESKTFLLGSYKVNAGGVDDCDQSTCDVNISSPTQISVQRNASGVTLDWHGFAVSMTDSTSVQRGTRVQSSALASDSFDITTPVVLANSWVHPAGSSGVVGSGSWPGTNSAQVMDAHVSWDFVDSDTIRVQHLLSSIPATDNDISWEVIEWDVGAAAAPRRVMVR